MSKAQATAQPATGKEDFAAALAQSLAATPADPAATTGSSAAKTATEPATAPSESHPDKHSADATPDALALLENALAGVLAGASATPIAPNAPGAAAGGSSSQDGPATAAQGASSALGSQLIQTLAADAKVSGSTPAPAAGSSAAATTAAPAASPAPTASTAVAALAAAQLTAGSQAALQRAAPADAKGMALSAPVGSSTWTDELGAKVTWMAHQGIESASLQLSPEHLGPLQVSISVHNGQASVWFGAAQPDTRTALQQSLPQLRQLFANQGLTLADAGVSRESPRGHGRQPPTRGAAGVAGVAAVSHDGSASRAPVAGGLGLVDTYA